MYLDKRSTCSRELRQPAGGRSRLPNAECWRYGVGLLASLVVQQAEEVTEYKSTEYNNWGKLDSLYSHTKH